MVVSQQKGNKHWKWGMFYYNPDDPRVIIREGFDGRTTWYTLNFAHKASYIYLAIILTFAAVVIHYGKSR